MSCSRPPAESPPTTPSGARAAPNPAQWLLKGLVKCGVCGVGTNCHKMRGRNGTWHRYYYCRNHDPLRAGGESRRCPERNIRADALDAFVFDHIRAAITHPDQLLAGEQAVTLHTPIPDDELLAAELARLDRKIDAADTERRRLIDLYQGGFIELPEMQRRATEVSSRRKELQHKRTSLAHERTALARDNQLRRRVHDFAARIHAVIDTLDDTQKQQLLRLLIEDVRVTGWHVQIRLRIALDPPPPDPPPDQPNRQTVTTPAPSVNPRRFAFRWWHSKETATASKTETSAASPPSRPTTNETKLVNFRLPTADQFSVAVDTLPPSRMPHRPSRPP